MISKKWKIKFFGESRRASLTFYDIVDFLDDAIKAKSDAEDFIVDENNFLSVGFQNRIGFQRGAIRTIE